MNFEWILRGKQRQNETKKLDRMAKQGMEGLIAVLILGLFFSISSLGAEPKSWGPESGPMSWMEAVTYCHSSGMRLPTRKELLDVHQTGGQASWKYAHYWTGEEASAGWAHNVHISIGRVEVDPKTWVVFVRCVR